MIQCSLFSSNTIARRPQRRASPSTASPTRPRRRADKRATVSTTSDPQPVDSAQFTVVAASPITLVTVDNTNPSRRAGARTQYVVGFTTSATGGGMSGAANSRIDVTFPTGTTFAGYVSATVRNLTTATNVGSCGNDSGLVIQCSLFSATRSAPATTSRITFNGITNPPIEGTDNRARVSTTSDTADRRLRPVRRRRRQPDQRGHASTTRTRRERAGARTQYVVGFTTSATGGGMSGAANSRIDVTFPTGTTFAGYVSATVRNLTTATNVGSCGNASGLVIQCSLFSANTIGAGHNVAHHLQRHHQPALPGHRQPRQGLDNVRHRRPSTPPNSASSPASRSPRSTRRAREYDGVGDHAVRRALRHLELGRPFGRCQQPDRDHVPRAGRRSAATRTATVHDVTANANVGSCGNPSGLVIQCSLFSSNTIAPGHAIRVTFTSITNPAAPGSYSVRAATTSDLPSITSSPYQLGGDTSAPETTIERVAVHVRVQRAGLDVRVLDRRRRLHAVHVAVHAAGRARPWRAHLPCAGDRRRRQRGRDAGEQHLRRSSSRRSTPTPIPTVAPTPTVTPTPEPTPQFNQTVVVEPVSGTVRGLPEGREVLHAHGRAADPDGLDGEHQEGRRRADVASAPRARRRRRRCSPRASSGSASAATSPNSSSPSRSRRVRSGRERRRRSPSPASCGARAPASSGPSATTARRRSAAPAGSPRTRARARSRASPRASSPCATTCKKKTVIVRAGQAVHG